MYPVITDAPGGLQEQGTERQGQSMEKSLCTASALLMKLAENGVQLRLFLKPVLFSKD